jgi:hypothetical protein
MRHLTIYLFTINLLYLIKIIVTGLKDKTFSRMKLKLGIIIRLLKINIVSESRYNYNYDNKDCKITYYQSNHKIVFQILQN